MHVGITPVGKSYVTEEVAQKLKDLIMSGYYAPGEKMPSMKDLAASLQVAIPSVREALRYLESLGLIHIRHGAGVFVSEDATSPLRIRPIISSAPLDEKVLEDLMGVRHIMETSAAELAATRATDEQIARLHELLLAMENSIDEPEMYSLHNADFHIAVCECSNNAILLSFLNAVRDLILAHQKRINISSDLRRRSLEWHRKIYEAIATRDAKKARDAMSAHLQDVEAEVR